MKKNDDENIDLRVSQFHSYFFPHIEKNIKNNSSDVKKKFPQGKTRG